MSTWGSTVATWSGLETSWTGDAGPTFLDVQLQDSWPPRVLITVSSVPIDAEVEVYRVVAGERTLLRPGAITAVDSNVLVVDAELPFGVAVSYVVRIDGEDTHASAAATYSLPGGKVAVSDATTASAAEVVITAWPEKTIERVASTFVVGGRNVVVAGPRGQFTSDIEVFTETTSAAANLARLLESATGGTVQVRQAGGYDGVDCYVAVLTDAERRFSQDGSDQRRLWTLRVAQVDGWAPGEEARGWTLGDLDAAFEGETLDDIRVAYSTLLAIAQADLGV